MPSDIASSLAANVRPVPLPADTPADVRVWRVEIDLAAPLAIASGGILQEHELARARRFMLHADAARFATVRASLRMLLAAQLHADAARLAIETDASGRPMLAMPDAALDFNVSHSGAYGMIAMTAKRRVGVDIEEGRASIRWRELEPMVLSPADRRVIDSLPATEQRGAFFDCWAAKEAVLKAHGTGMGAGAIGMDAFSVLPREGARYALSAEAGAFAVSALDAPASYACALAWSL
jgi:4'-phosphopantetheinyl transferase